MAIPAPVVEMTKSSQPILIMNPRIFELVASNKESTTIHKVSWFIFTTIHNDSQGELVYFPQQGSHMVSDFCVLIQMGSDGVLSQIFFPQTMCFHI